MRQIKSVCEFLNIMNSAGQGSLAWNSLKYSNYNLECYWRLGMASLRSKVTLFSILGGHDLEDW